MAGILENLQGILQELDPLTFTFGLILVAVIIVTLLILRREKMKKRREQISEDLEAIKAEVTGEKPKNLPEEKAFVMESKYPPERYVEELVKGPDFSLEAKRELELPMPDNNYQEKVRSLVDALSRRLGNLKLEKKEIADKNISLKTRWEEILKEEKEINKILASVQGKETG